MISLIHLLEHLGLPSGVAIGIVIACRKLLTAGLKMGVRRDRDRGSIRG